MINPLVDKRHLKEYVLFGLAAAIVFTIPVIIFLSQNQYENFYYLFIGSGLFMLVILYYAYKLLYRPYDKKRVMSMVIAGHLATLTGVIFSCILATICFLFFFFGNSPTVPVDRVVENVPATIQPNQSISLLLMIYAVATIANFSVGSFISVVTAYAGKVNQTRNKPATLETNL